MGLPTLELEQVEAGKDRKERSKKRISVRGPICDFCRDITEGGDEPVVVERYPEMLDGIPYFLVSRVSVSFPESFGTIYHKPCMFEKSGLQTERHQERGRSFE